MGQANDVDMSPQAITRRLKEIFQLKQMCDKLAKARPLGPVENSRPPARKPKDTPAEGSDQINRKDPWVSE